MKNRFVRFGALVSGVTFAAASQAAPVDVTAIVTEIGDQAAPVAAIGGAVLLIYVGVKAFQWVRRALS